MRTLEEVTRFAAHGVTFGEMVHPAPPPPPVRAGDPVPPPVPPPPPPPPSNDDPIGRRR